MDYLLLIVSFVAIAGSLYIGFRIGRATGTSSASRRSNYSAVPGVATTEDINNAVDAAIRTNAETAAIVQKMRDILERNSSKFDSSVSSEGD